MKTITQIIELAGGDELIAQRLDLTVDNVRSKWPLRGVRDQYWHTLITLAEKRGNVITPAEIYEANRVVRRALALT